LSPVNRLLGVAILFSLVLIDRPALAQLRWDRMDTAFPGLPPSVQVYRTQSPLQGRPHIAWYLAADLAAGDIEVTTDTTTRRRLTPSGFYARNQEPLAVVNGTFFSFADSRNLNAVMRDGKLLAYNVTSIPRRGRDTGSYNYVTRGAIGIDRHGRPDVAWLLTDSSRRHAIALEKGPLVHTGTDPKPRVRTLLAEKRKSAGSLKKAGIRKRWKVRTAIAGGPILVQEGRIFVTNNEEQMFAGKALEDLHPRTAMGYTRDGKLIILVVQGRSPGEAEGASLTDLARMMVELGALEAVNLDGGGSSCLLVQGRETIRPSDKTGQRPVPAVLMIRKKR
jgi:hypothetical protein